MAATMLRNEKRLLQLLFCICLFVDFSLTFSVSINQASSSAGNKDYYLKERSESNLKIRKVHIIFMNHLDVGFTKYLGDVINLYFHTHFPTAIKRAEELRIGGYTETFKYTTHPWLVSMYLDCPKYLRLKPAAPVKCPSPEALKNFTKAVRDGVITWHAGPMNMQFEFLDEPLLEHALNLSRSLDNWFNIERKYRTLSQRDVPGMTQAVIPSLVKQGIVALSVGVNAFSAPPAVPKIFNWVYNGQRVIAMWHPDGYPYPPGPDPAHPGGISIEDCVTFEGFDEAMCFSFRTDNTGPPQSLKEVLHTYEILHSEFPNSKLAASTFENFTAAVYPIRNKLPNISGEIGDTWIQGIQSDPRKVAEMKLFLRNRADCLKKGACSYHDPRFFNSSRLLLKTGEHTWGRDDIGDYTHWSNERFAKVRSTEKFKDWPKEWNSQRHFTKMALNALGLHPLASNIKTELADLRNTVINLKGYIKVHPKPVTCSNGVLIQFDSTTGLIKELVDPQTKTSWASDKFGLAKFLYVTYNDTDFSQMGKFYSYGRNNVGIMKPNMTNNVRAESKVWKPKMINYYQKIGNNCDFYIEVGLDKKANQMYGAPEKVWVHYNATGKTNDLGVDVTLYVLDKKATRMPEAMFMSFEPKPQPGYRWLMSKVGQIVDPMNIIVNGSQRHHAVDKGVMYVDKSGNGIEFSSKDVAVVSTITKTLPASAFPVPVKHTDPITGMSFLIQNNVWNVNWIDWYPFNPEDKTFKSRFSIRFRDKRPTQQNKVMFRPVGKVVRPDKL